MEKITFCIPSKSNLRYLKTCIKSIRDNAYRKDHDIIVFVDQDNDGTVKWLEEYKDEYKIDYFVNPYLNEKLFGIGKAYDFCIENSKTDVFMIFHADMMLGINADKNAYDHLKENTVVCSTRVEPPIHPNAGEKILEDFGLWPEEFNSEGFDKFVTSRLFDTKITEGIFAPWMMYKKDFEVLGGHDPILKSAREDSNLFNRMLIAGFDFKQPWNSLVYHLTGRGGQFQHGEITKDHEKKSQEWQQLMNNSTLDYIRKWGTQVLHTPLMKPIIIPRYNIAFVIKNCNYDILAYVEPYADRIYLEDDMQVITDTYIQNNQPNTEFNLRKRVLNLTQNDPEGENDVVIYFDRKTILNEDYKIIPIFPRVLNQIEQPGTYSLGSFEIKVNSIETYEKNFVNLNNNIYKNKFIENEK